MQQVTVDLRAQVVAEAARADHAEGAQRMADNSLTLEQAMSHTLRLEKEDLQDKLADQVRGAAGVLYEWTVICGSFAVVKVPILPHGQ